MRLLVPGGRGAGCPFPFARTACNLEAENVNIIAQNLPVSRPWPNSRLANVCSLLLLLPALGVGIFSWLEPKYSDLSSLALILGLSAVYVRLGVWPDRSESADDLRKLYSRK